MLEYSTLDLPAQEPIALSEYSNHKIFCMTFPWLFPGGIGDFNDFRKIEITSALDWAKHLNLYFDGRFTRDELWCFYAQNFAARRRSTEQGHFYIRNLSRQRHNNGNQQDEQPPTTVEEIIDEVKRGNTQFIDKLSYFAQNITGSNAYWRSKRDELYSWINYHIDNGSGP